MYDFRYLMLMHVLSRCRDDQLSRLFFSREVSMFSLGEAASRIPIRPGAI